MTVELKAKSGEGGRLFGSITNKQIADEMKKTHNIKVDRRKIVLDDAIRSLGVTKVSSEATSKCHSNNDVHVKEEN